MGAWRQLSRGREFRGEYITVDVYWVQGCAKHPQRLHHVHIACSGCYRVCLLVETPGEGDML